MRRRRSGTLNILRIAARNFSILPPGGYFTSAANLHHCSASLLDLLPSTFSKPVRRNTQRLRNFAVAEHNNVMLRLLDQTPFVQHFRSDLFVGIEVLLESGETDLQPLLLEDVGKTALRQTAVQRHLAAFETDLPR